MKSTQLIENVSLQYELSAQGIPKFLLGSKISKELILNKI